MAGVPDAAASVAAPGSGGGGPEQQESCQGEPKTLWGNSEPWPPAAGPGQPSPQQRAETLGFYESDRGRKKKRSLSDLSLLRFISAELTRGYFLEHNEAKYTERRERVYTCMRIPKELEKLMFFGIFLCLDAFLYVFTLLPLRVFLAMFRFITLPCYGLRQKGRALSLPL